MSRELRNLETDPNALRGRYQWGCHTVMSEDGRHYTYIGRGNSFMGSCTSSIATTAPVGHVIVLIARTAHTEFANSSIWAADELLATQDGDTYVKASRVTETGRLHELTISKCTTGVTILGSALYTPDDWEQVLTLYRRGVLQWPWFAGDTLP